MPYGQVTLWAILPAILYFTGIFIAVHLEAKKLGLKGIPRSELPNFWKLQRSVYLLLPLVILVWLVTANIRSLQFSASIAILIAIVVSLPSTIGVCRKERAEGKYPDPAGSKKPKTNFFAVKVWYPMKRNICHHQPDHYFQLSHNGRGKRFACVRNAAECGKACKLRRRVDRKAQKLDKEQPFPPAEGRILNPGNGQPQAHQGVGRVGEQPDQGIDAA